MDKYAIVTGGTRGIGRAISMGLAEDGYHLLIVYAGNTDAAEKTLSDVKSVMADADQECILLKADLATEEGCTEVIDTALSHFGRIDVLVNNAGITRDGLLARMTAEDFDSVIATNLRSAFLLSQKVTRTMMKQRYGRIINLSSVVGVHGNAGQANYAASKAGIIGLTKSIAKELASRNITCNAIAPGFIETEMTEKMSDAIKEQTLQSIPMKKPGQPEDIAHLVRFLVSDNAKYITGQVIGVDGGMGI